MLDIAFLTRQVRRNCTLSDARFAGHYSVCGLVMRLMMRIFEFNMRAVMVT